MAVAQRGPGGRAAVVDLEVSDWSDLDPNFTRVCSSATLQSDRRGFFLDLAEEVADEAGLGFVEEFGRLPDDARRLSACHAHPRVRDRVRAMLASVQPVYRDKAADVSAQRRLEGERVLRGSNARGALTALSQAVMRAPASGQEPLLALALWARSEALLQLRHFQPCLDDVQLSMRSGLPEDKRLDAFYRMGLCQHGLGDVKRAAASLQVAARLLDRVASAAERTAWTATIQQAMGALRVPREGKPSLPVQAPAGPAPPLAAGQHPQMPAASSLLRVSRSKAAGRQMVAAQPIRTGDTLVVEAPEAACLLPDKFGTHCLHCFGRLLAPVACATCSGVAFCGRACLSAAEPYHRHECRHLGLLLGSGMSVLCHLALRAVTQRGLAFLRGLRGHLPPESGPDAAPAPAPAALSDEQRRFLSVCALEAHEDRRPARDFFHRCIMALFLLRILQDSGFFPEASSVEGDLNEDEILVGSILLRLLQILQFNAHEVYETVILPRPAPKVGEAPQEPRSKFRSARVVYIGVAVYPTVALFNHDCYPAVTRHFRGKDIVVTATRPLAEGDVVAENYGPIFTKRTLAQRRRTLNSRYWFHCSCAACAEDWPLMEQLAEDDFKFRCPAAGCEQTMRAPRAQDAVGQARCPRCGRDVDLDAVRGRLQAARAGFDAALDAMERDEPKAALPWLCRFLDDMHALTRPPVRSVHLAQEALRTCLADAGNLLLHLGDIEAGNE
ncbi:SET and MYND domain-containing protein 4 [Frankliniella fusca]|uniref:SET and MYND domain-containing protein 4 n=1 Tax=Frankliniella fusca TaxID=407009 RepID=A0AAE1LDG9_9NEOP|nr:SET and MYND domain-containing protein 4 [Frankliniella fusca]